MGRIEYRELVSLVSALGLELRRRGVASRVEDALEELERHKAQLS